LILPFNPLDLSTIPSAVWLVVWAGLFFVYVVAQKYGYWGFLLLGFLLWLWIVNFPNS